MITCLLVVLAFVGIKEEIRVCHIGVSIAIGEGIRLTLLIDLGDRLVVVFFIGFREIDHDTIFIVAMIQIVPELMDGILLQFGGMLELEEQLEGLNREIVPLCFVLELDGEPLDIQDLFLGTDLAIHAIAHPREIVAQEFLEMVFGVRGIEGIQLEVRILDNFGEDTEAIGEFRIHGRYTSLVTRV
jgi:hypothetical protein